MKWTKKVALWLTNCAIFNLFLVHKNRNPDSKLKYKACLMNVAKAWATDKMEASETESDTDLVRPGRLTSTSCKSRVDSPGRLSGDMQKHVLVKIVKSEHGKNEYPTRQCHVCALHKSGETHSTSASSA
jgi:hypothetical protein